MNEYEINNQEFSNPESITLETLNYENPGLRYISNARDMTQGSNNAAGLDLHVYSIDKDWIGTGIHVAIPQGMFGMVVPRSSLGLKGFQLKNTLGVIDSDYRGEIKLAYEGYTPEVGERVAQLIVLQHYTGPVERMASIDDLDVTDRGTGGFGSTGV